MRISDWSSDVCSSDLAVERGEYAHYMLKEIYEQPRALADTPSERLLGDHVLEAAPGPAASRILPLVQSVHIVACGTSYHAGLVARYYLEQGARVTSTVEGRSGGRRAGKEGFSRWRVRGAAHRYKTTKHTSTKNLH